VIFTRTGALSYFQFPLLEKFSGLRHGVFTRDGGSGATPRRGLNVSLGAGDSERDVRQNRDRIARAMGIDSLLFARQTHGTRILVYRNGLTPEGVDPAGPPAQGDALVTDAPNRLLVIQVADCQPVMIYDPTLRVIANVHSGWRGSIRNILGRTVAVMAETFGCRPGDLVAGIGPSLGPCCAEFVHYRSEIPSRYWPYKDPLDRFDFWAMSVDQLTGAGLDRNRIDVSRLCTRCRTDLFFSYRGERDTGRFAAVIGRI
jgi:YfiH family protein